MTPQTVFRGFTAGDIIGPYVSQFFLQPFTFGVMPFVGYLTTLPGDFGIDATSWLNLQNGAPNPIASENPDPNLRFLGTPGATSPSTCTMTCSIRSISTRR